MCGQTERRPACDTTLVEAPGKECLGSLRVRMWTPCPLPKWVGRVPRSRLQPGQGVAMSGDGQKLTIDDMFRDPTRVHRRISELVQQRDSTERLFPGSISRHNLTRWERLARWARRRTQPWRESIALRIAPTLHRDEDCDYF